jgi:hypothetical protein
MFFTKPSPNLNPKPGFLGNFRTLNPTPDQNWIFKTPQPEPEVTNFSNGIPMDFLPCTSPNFDQTSISVS